MYTGLLHFHSLLRWILLLLLITAVVKAYSGWTGRKVFTESDRKISLYTLITTHLQLVLGVVLYFISDLVRGARMDMAAAMKDSVMRFWVVEHLLMMLIAVILITVGHSKAKKATTDEGKFRYQAIFFGIALVLIILSIPWPFRAVGADRGWF
jgi:low temperature requirement protein LtrA